MDRSNFFFVFGPTSVPNAREAGSASNVSPSSQAEGRSRLATPRTSDTPGIIRECSKTHRGRRIAVNKELSSETRTLDVAEVEIDPCRRHRWAWARKLHALLVYQQQCFGEDDGYKHANVDSDNNTIAPLVIHTKHNSAQRNQASPGHPHHSPQTGGLAGEQITR